MPEKAPRKTAAKKTSRTTTAKTATTTRAAAKRAPAKRTRVTRAAAATTAPTAPRRKAPTPIASQAASSRQSSRLLLSGVFAFTFCFVVSAAIGFTDAGAINVRAVIDARRSNATDAERAQLDRLNRSDAETLPNGGLVPSADQSGALPVQRVEAASTTTSSTTVVSASSTEALATSTETVSSDEVTNVPAEQAEVPTAGE